MVASESAGLVLFAYDGSELAGFAIGRAATQLALPCEAVIVCVWQPADVGFTPVGGQHFDADQAVDVRNAAEQTAAHGAELAEQAGFRARAMAVEAAPIWKGIVTAAEDEGATLIVLGAHLHAGLAAHVFGHVTPAVVSHSRASVLVVHADE